MYQYKNSPVNSKLTGEFSHLNIGMLLSEAKAQARTVLNEAFYAYHAHEELINKMHIGNGWMGYGVYLLASANPNYKGTPNGESWMVPNLGWFHFGSYVYKCVIPGDLDKTVLPSKDVTYYGISRGEIKSFSDIEPWLKKNNAPDELLVYYNKLKKRISNRYKNPEIKKVITQTIEEIRKRPSLETNRLYTISLLSGMIDKLNDAISKWTEFYHFAKNKFNKAWKLIKLIDDITSAQTVKSEEHLKYYTKLLEETKNVLNLDVRYIAFVRSRCIDTADCENNIELIQTVINSIFAEKLDLVLRGINYYFEKAKKWYMDDFAISNLPICDDPQDICKFKDFLRKLNIIGFYWDKYCGAQVNVEEVFIFDPKDVKIVAVKHIGKIREIHNDPLSWDENGYPLEKYIDHEGNKLPEGNKWFTPDEYEGADHEEYVGDKMTPVDTRIEDRYGKDNAQYLKDNHPNTKYYPNTKSFTTKNPHYRGGSWSWQQPSKNFSTTR